MAFNKIFTVGEWASILLHGALRRSFQAEGWSATSKMLLTLLSGGYKLRKWLAEEI